MYVIFEDGSRQYRVSEGDVVRLDSREGEVGQELELGRVLLLQADNGLTVGRPLVDGARVIVQVVDHPSVKTTIQKFRRRKTYIRYRGHRQPFIAVKVLHILAPGQERPARREEGAEGQTAGAGTPEGAEQTASS